MPFCFFNVISEHHHAEGENQVLLQQMMKNLSILLNMSQSKRGKQILLYFAQENSNS